MGLTRTGIVVALACTAYRAAVLTNYAPTSWASASLCAWLSHTTVSGWRRLSTWEQRHLLWGMASLLAFLQFLVIDPTFQVPSFRAVAVCCHNGHQPTSSALFCCSASIPCCQNTL